MSATDMKIEQAALDWLVRVNDPAFDQWDAWEAWLAADARHAETYWRLAEAEGEAVEALKSAPPRRAAAVVRRGVQFPLPRRAVMAAAVGALAVGLGWIGWTQTPRPWSVETAPGEQRTVSLADGSKITLDGGTRLSMDRRKPREVTLEGGRALFDVVHDDARPFIVGVGEAILTDLGTVFDVTHLQNGARVAVSEGSVRVDARGDSATLNPGDSVVASPRGLERRPVDIEAVDDWREGRLSWNGERLDVVAQDLARALNRPIRIAPALAGRSFSGSLNIGPDARDQRERIALLLGVTVIEDGEGWRLEP